ncbi:hypothetical protein [Streptomyces sp. MJM1172]|uniref:hypothetical protein n=1 Tax=Streptomyces sp. MJM1172 TaxID=1703926 RepID=UPI000AACCB9B|nr:hypothetical protein [Streptomyces sp. MJM1172]
MENEQRVCTLARLMAKTNSKHLCEGEVTFRVTSGDRPEKFVCDSLTHLGGLVAALTEGKDGAPVLVERI